MSVGSKKAKELAKKRLPNNYAQTPEDEAAYLYCVRNNIRISPCGVAGHVGSWSIGISTPNNYKKINNSPEICDEHTVWQVFYKYCSYYYNKRNGINTNL